MAGDAVLEDLEEGLRCPEDVVDRGTFEVVVARRTGGILAVHVEDIAVPVVGEASVRLRLDVEVVRVRIGNPTTSGPLVLLHEHQRCFGGRHPPRYGDRDY